MSTEIKTTMTEHTAVRHFGGADKGMCLQVTASAPLRVRNTISEQIQEEGYIDVTMEEAAAMCETLGEFITAEAKRRQGLLRDMLVNLKDADRTVLHEVAELPEELMAVPRMSVSMVSQLCPKTRIE